MTIGNGFFGIRGSQEEDYRNQVRGMFAAGVYNRPLGAESAELVNLPDVIRWEIKIDGEHFSLETMKVLAYERALFRNGRSLNAMRSLKLLKEKKWKSLLVVLLIKIISIRQP